MSVFVNYAVVTAIVSGIGLALYLYFSDGPVLEQERFSDDAESQNYN